VTITPAAILALSPGNASPDVTAAKLQAACDRFGITDRRSVAALLANLDVESDLTPKREGGYYTTTDRLRLVYPSYFDPAHGGLFNAASFVRDEVKLFNLVYSNRLGNGPTESGDGYNFRGAGFVQLTGRSNFNRTGLLIGQPLEPRPELMQEIGVSCLAAAAYWARLSSADQLARAGNIAGTRYAVNGPRGLNLAAMLMQYARVLPLL
jgi:putative chitinase